MLLRLFRFLKSSLRANFLAGLFVAVPFAITIAFLLWVWQQIDDPLNNIFKIASKPQGMPWSRLFDAITESKYGDEKFVIPLVGLGILLLVVLTLGVIARSIIGRIALAGVENAVARMPVVGMIYTSFRQFSEAFMTSDGASKFQRVVAVQFPYKGCWAVGFVTGKAVHFLPQLAKLQDKQNELISVVVPSTPFPTTSFMIVVPENETIKLDIAVKDALKLVISGGVLSPGESLRLRAVSGSDPLSASSQPPKPGGTSESAQPGTL